MGGVYHRFHQCLREGKNVQGEAYDSDQKKTERLWRKGKKNRRKRKYEGKKLLLNVRTGLREIKRGGRAKP